jgi:endoglucanase
MGAAGHSFVVGFGCSPPRNPHHCDSTLLPSESGNWDIFKGREFNAYELTGALVAGPDAQDNWKDDRMDFQYNEVALDFNAALFLGTVQCAR